MGFGKPSKMMEKKPEVINEDYIKEKELRDHPKSINKKDFKKIYNQMEKSVCKIKCKDGSSGTGFFCNIPFPDDLKLLPVLITNYHVLGDDDISKDNNINVLLNDEESEYNIYIKAFTKTYTDSIYDISIIEIETKLDLDKVSFLEIEDNILNIDDYKKYINNSIYLLHYPHGKNIEFSIGIIKDISEDNYNIDHLCETQTGSSGSPIFNLKSYKVIGIHKGADKKKILIKEHSLKDQ